MPYYEEPALAARARPAPQRAKSAAAAPAPVQLSPTELLEKPEIALDALRLYGYAIKKTVLGNGFYITPPRGKKWVCHGNARLVAYAKKELKGLPIPTKG